MPSCRAVRAAAAVQPDSARDRLLSSMLDAAIAVVRPGQAAVATGPDTRPDHRALALQGDAITSRPLDNAQIAVPLLAHFAVMWFEAARPGQARRVGLRALGDAGVHCGGQQLELAIAVAIATVGVASGQALAGVVGPLIEGLSWSRWFTSPSSPGAGGRAPPETASRPRQRSLDDESSVGPVRLRAQRGSFPDGRRPAQPPCAPARSRFGPPALHPPTRSTRRCGR